MAEIAIVSARKNRLRSLADAGDTSARRALELAASPNTFLATACAVLFLRAGESMPAA